VAPPLPGSKFPNGDVALWPLITRGTGGRWLDGRTADNSVGIANSTWDPFTGTHWTAQEVSPGIITLKMTLFPQDRFLDGRTADGSVGLSNAADAVHSGSFWEPIITNHVVVAGSSGPPPVDADVYDVWILRCLGTIDGSRFLDYRSQNNSVGLARFIDGPFTGTRWTVVQNPPQGAAPIR
jgi:hypothetical protein